MAMHHHGPPGLEVLQHPGRAALQQGLVGRADRLVVSSPLEAPIPLEVLRFADGSRMSFSSLAAPASARTAATADGALAEAFVALTPSDFGLTETAALVVDDALRFV